MRVVTGTIVEGKVVLDGVSLDEGTTVTVIAAEGDEVFELTPADEAALLASIAEADSSELVDATELLADLSRGR